MKIVYIMIGALTAGTAFAAPNPALLDLPPGSAAPQVLTLDSYTKWAAPMLKPGYASLFTGKVFEWFENEKSRDLPPETYADAGKIYVSVDRPLQQTIELEQSGDIEEGNTVGAEVYSLMDGSVHEVLNTMLYRWGKPADAEDGKTYAPGGQFARRIDYWAPNANWGAQAFASLSLRKDGGIVKDIADRYIVLIRGNDAQGYDVIMQFVRPGGTTLTKQCFAMAIIRPAANGKTSYKLSTRFQGQSYKVLGNVRIGRAQIGFNVAKVRAIQEETMGMLKELRSTGKIADHKTDIEYGKNF
jgi:hypothetical protein